MRKPKKPVNLTAKQIAFLAELNKTVVKIRKCMHETFNLMREIKKEKDDNYGLMKKVIYTNECVDQTLCNVLLAIRQNEYLQAWYPDKALKKKDHPERAADKILKAIQKSSV